MDTPILDTCTLVLCVLDINEGCTENEMEQGQRKTDAVNLAI